MTDPTEPAHTAASHIHRDHAALAGVWIPLVTPFRDNAVDHAALAALTRGLSGQGIAGFVVCGSTGEAAALDEAEQLACLQTVAEAAPGCPLIMGLGSHHLPDALRQVRALSRLADAPVPALGAVLVAAPPYIRPSQAGLRVWFESLADASALPLVVLTITRDTLLALAAHPRIVGVKDCGGDLGKTHALLADGRLAVLAGEDVQFFSALALGAAGSITASAHLDTARWVAVQRAIQAGDLARARALWRPLVPLVEALFAEPNPAVVKAALAHQGRLTDGLRAPMQPATAAARAQLERALAALASAPSLP